MTSGFRSTVFFAIAVVVLCGSAIKLQMAKQSGSLTMIKKAVPLLKPLHELDRRCIAPFEFAADRQLPAETVHELGTREYVDWVVQRDYEGENYRFQLSVTYYTGVQDQLPHVPEECYNEGAFSIQDDDTEEIEMPKFGRSVDLRIQSYNPPHPTGAMTFVYYSICVNGDFYVRREFAKNRMVSPKEKYLYYSKVEVSFEGRPGSSLEVKRRLAIELYDLVLVELRKSHWPPIPAE